MPDTPIRFSLPKWYDLHVHLRQGEAMRAYIQAQLDMGCAGLVAMPNTAPPVTFVDSTEDNTEDNTGDQTQGWDIDSYRGMIMAAGGDRFDAVIVPLYLSAATTPGMIRRGVQSGLLQACKYYPPHGTTGAQSAAPLELYHHNGVLAAMEKEGVILCLHGEAHGLSGQDYFDRGTNAEDLFYTQILPDIAKAYPGLKIVCEHITTAAACDFVRHGGDNVAATVTPQHLLYTIGDLLQGLKYHLYCLPVVKFEKDRAALRSAVTDPDNTRFFAGTDSAPHTHKATPCGCAAGCFTGGIAPQLYAQAFELAGTKLDAPAHQDIFRRFLCENGARFYGLALPEDTFTLRRSPQPVEALSTPDGAVTPLPLGMGLSSLPWSLA